MLENSPTHIGQITILSLRNFILDRGLGKNDVVLLNRINFDDIILEFRHTYNESIAIPYYLLSVLIIEDESNKIALNRIKAKRNDNRRFEGDYLPKLKDLLFEDLDYYDKIIYQCGWCGKIVNSDGAELDSISEYKKIEVLKKFSNVVSVQIINGRCCPR